MHQIFNKPIEKVSYLKSKRLEWVARIWKSEGFPKNLFTGRLNCKTSRGRSRQRWADIVKMDLMEISEEFRIDDSEDRNR